MRGVSSAVRFLTPLLGLCPEIGAVRLIDKGTTIVFEFYLNKAFPTDRLREWIKDIKAAYDSYFFVSGIADYYINAGRAHSVSRSTESMSDGSLKKVCDYDDFPELIEAINSSSALEVERDIASLSYEEISMLMNLMSEEFKESLVRSKCSAEDASALVQQLRHNLDLLREEVRTNVNEKGDIIEQIPNIIGYCDDMRIVVSYANKQK